MAASRDNQAHPGSHMPAEQRRDVEEIVRRAAELGPRERLAFVHSACGGDADLYDAVIEHASQSGMSDLAGELLTRADASAALGDARLAGELIGPYRIVRVLGRGGMGVVYLCERADDQFHRQVAIKLVASGLISRQIQNRLRTERQILATLDHPNIARLLDGGTTADGVPYLVMEYVEGEPIDTYCDRRELTIGDRLQLFRTVCSAVQAAHRNLVVHRDLKPSNILVTADGTPKLLDFGIAKLLDARATAHTVAVTQADIRVLTPDHASPEQIRGQRITTASDVYVLGVLLYELLSGRRPFKVEGLRLVDIERLICEQPPLPPSQALGAAEMGRTELARAAARRRVTAARLRRQLAGDLDNIVLMAMRKEPERRYGSVEQLAADIANYMRGMPVIARRDTWSYRTRKFIGRHSAGVAFATALAILLVGFAAATYVQAERIRQQRDAANIQRSRAEQVSAFLVDLFRSSDPTEARGAEVTAGQLLERGARRIDMDLEQDPESQSHMMEAIGRVYLSMGESEKALPLLERSLALRRNLYGADDVLTASSMQSLARVRHDRGEYAAAEKLLRDALAIQQRKLGFEHESVAATLYDLGWLLMARGEWDAAERVYRQGLDIYVATGKERDRGATTVMDGLATVLMYKGDHTAAETLYRRALAINRQLRGADHPDVAVELLSLAMALQGQSRLEEAQPLFTESIDILRRVNGPQHPHTITALGNYGWFLQIKGELDRAESVLREVLALDRGRYGERHAHVGHDKSSLADVLYEQGRSGEAEALYREALTIFEAALPSNHQYVASALVGLARIFAERGDESRVGPLVDRAVGIWRKELPADHWRIANAQAALGLCLLERQEFPESERILLASLRTLESQRGATDPDTRRVRAWLIRLYDAWGKPADADRYRTRGSASMTGSFPPDLSTFPDTQRPVS
jgi:serine/threonine-protein kinase